MKLKWTLITASFMLLLSCGSDTTSDGSTITDSTKEEICILPAPNRLNELTWILGEWQIEGADEVTSENWILVNENLFSGECYMIEKKSGDTAFYETIEIRHESTGLVYSPIVSDQNDNQPVNFLLTELTDSTVVFVNMEHDYPQKITYQRFGEDSLFAKVAGTYEGEQLEDVFPYTRKK